MSGEAPTLLRDPQQQPLRGGALGGRRAATWIMLLLILGCGAWLRLRGVDWDEGYHLHPDERFLTMVALSLEPGRTPGEAARPDEPGGYLDGYLDTGRSGLNPHNVGSRPDYVYGTAPVIGVRMLADMLGATSYRRLPLVGRHLSAAADLMVVLLVFLMASRLFGRRCGLLAAAFSAVTVLQIQLSHFFVVDPFMNLLSTLTLWLAVLLSTSVPRPGAGQPACGRGRVLALATATGAAAGAATAVKLSAAPAVLLLVGALVALRLWRSTDLKTLALALAAGGAASMIVFRLLQPYAFAGPGLLDLAPSEEWARALRVLAAQSGPFADAPPALQWARRPIWFSAKNMILWGMGPGYALLAWGGLVWLGRRMLAGRERRALLLWLWVGGYLCWQSLASNPTMRYQLPVYSGMAVLAGWAVVRLWDLAAGLETHRTRPAARRAVAMLAVLCLGASLAWAVAFSGIYTRPVTRVAASRWLLGAFPGPLSLGIGRGSTEEAVLQPIPYSEADTIVPGAPADIVAQVLHDGPLRFVELGLVVTDDDPGRGAEPASALELSVEVQAASGTAIGTARVPQPRSGVRRAVRLPLDRPLELACDEWVRLGLEVSGGSVHLRGAALANESSWDDGLPLRVDGLDPFAGIYQQGLNLELYWPDDQSKLARMLSILDQADAVIISSSRQWGSIPRLEERYPLSTAYYRHLLGCPVEQTVEHCYEVARPGMYSGDLGFDLVHVETSPPTLGPLVIDDQASEEAFTVYDHPKVLVFAKRPGFDPMAVARVLGAVDLDHVLHVLPAQARPHPMDLMLPADRLESLRASGTWEQLYGAWSRRSPALAAVVWYLVLTLLGLVCYPMLRHALPGLEDRGYALARTAGLLALAYPAWLAGSLGLGFTRMTISAVLLLLVIGNGVLAWRDRHALGQDLRRLRRHLLRVELLVLLLFLAGIALRLGNPDLWHPARGGEKPMELAYLNAVLKSTSFPPYDPWFEGGYLNYYYLGWVVVGTPVKWIGIPPTTAFNLILPTLLALIGVGAYTVSSELARRAPPVGRSHGPRSMPIVAGLAGIVLMVILGNLGTAKMVLDGLVRVGAAAGQAGGAAAGRLALAWQGLGRVLAGTPLPYSGGDWYWSPTRIIPDPQVGPITEMPCFTLLFGDLHPHLLDLPLALLVLGWLVSTVVVLRRPTAPDTPRWPLAVWVPVLLAGGIAVGALRATNTWSFYTYLLLACLGTGAAAWLGPAQEGRSRDSWARRLGRAGGVTLGLTVVAHLLYHPYAAWFASGYSTVEPWTGARTSLGIYLVHWGPMLLLIASWAALETVRARRVAADPASSPTGRASSRVDLWRILLPAGAGAITLALLDGRAPVAWLVVPLLSWLGVLVLRPGLEDRRRLIGLLAGTALAITLTVELVVLHGDIGRMNTVFKLYLQAWTLLAVAAGAGLALLLPELARRRRLLVAWTLPAAALVLGAALYPVVAVPARLADRMAAQAPHTLDGMAFMRTAQHWEEGIAFPLDEDLKAIQWMQHTIKGSPVLLEYNTPEYRWGSRFSCYTGLPGVVGWSWHQRQQRAVVPPQWVWRRIEAVRRFYDTDSVEDACAVLVEHDVRYVVAGRLEHAYARPEGMAKLERFSGVLWRAVFRDGETVIYEVDQGAVQALREAELVGPRARAALPAADQKSSADGLGSSLGQERLRILRQTLGVPQ